MRENTTSSFQKEIQKIENIKKIVLKDNTLIAEKISTIFEVTYECHPTTHNPFRPCGKKKVDEVIKHLSFKLNEITVEEIQKYRKSKTPSFVLKNEGKYFYTEIPKTLNFVDADIIGPHLCSQSCQHLSSASDERGGCAKVRGYATYIEKYDFITIGYETFNTVHDCLVVVNCQRYKVCKPQKNVTIEEMNRHKLNLAQFLYDDVENLADEKKKKLNNRNNFALFY